MIEQYVAAFVDVDGLRAVTPRDLGGRVPEESGQGNGTAFPALTNEQRQFAARVRADGALDGASVSGSVFLYRREGRRTTRWLIDLEGQVLELTGL